MSTRRYLTLNQIASLPEVQEVNFRRASNDPSVIGTNPTLYPGYSGTTHPVTSLSTWNSAVAAAAPGDVIDIQADIFSILRYQGNHWGSGGPGANGTFSQPIVIWSSNGSEINPGTSSDGRAGLEVYDCLGVWVVGLTIRNCQFAIYYRGCHGVGASDINSAADIPSGGLDGWLRVAHCNLLNNGHASFITAGYGTKLSGYPGTDTTTEEWWGSTKHLVLENCTINGSGVTDNRYGESVYIGNGGGTGTSWVSNAKQILVRYNTLMNPTSDYVDIKPGCYDIFVVDNIMTGGYFNLGAMFQVLYTANTPQPRPGWYDLNPNVHLEGNIVYNPGTGPGSSNYGMQVSLAGVTFANNLFFGVNTSQPLVRLRGVLPLEDVDSTSGGEKFWIANNLFWSLVGVDNVGYDAQFTQYPASLIVTENNLGYTGCTGVEETTEANVFWDTVPVVGSTGSTADAGFGVGSAFDWLPGNEISGTSITPTLFHNEDISQRSFSTPPEVGCFQVSTAGGVVAFPAVGDVTPGVNSGLSLSGTFSMPSVVNQNDVLVVISTWTGNNVAPTIGNSLGSWTNLAALNIAGAFQNFNIWALRADGSEGGQSETWSATQSKSNSYQVWRITGVYTSGGTGTAWDSISGQSFTNTPDPPELTAPWGSTKNFWIATQGSGATGASVTVWPSNYTLNQTSNIDGGMMTAAAGRQVETAAENPSAFSIDDTENTGYVTLVFRPA